MKIYLCCLSAALLASVSPSAAQAGEAPAALILAQMEKPATPSVSQSAKPMAMDMDAKKAKAKACSDQADAKGLHGKEREKFRAQCKKKF